MVVVATVVVAVTRGRSPGNLLLRVVVEAVVARSALEPFNPDPVCSSSSCLGRGLNRLRGELNRDVLDGLGVVVVCGIC